MPIYRQVEMQHNIKLRTKAFITFFCVITPGASDDDDDDDDAADDDADADADADHSDQQLLSLPFVLSHLVLICLHDDIHDLITENRYERKYKDAQKKSCNIDSIRKYVDFCGRLVPFVAK